jgi:hypothetical protein
MLPTTDEPVLFPDHAGPPEGVVVVNDRCRLQERDGYRTSCKAVGTLVGSRSCDTVNL